MAKSEKIIADIVVIGGGGCGLAAALSATEKGANVVLVEKQAIGGNSAVAQGLFAVESPLQKRMNIALTRDECFKIAMEYAHWRNDPKIVRAFVNKSGDTIRWLEDTGVQFEQIRDCYAGNVRGFHCLNPMKRGGFEITKAMHRKSEELGVKFLLHCPARQILTDASGRITGVIAETEGKEINISTKAVIIATGGFAGNRELLKKYHPSFDDHMQLFGVMNNTGDGLIMATELGAATEGLGTLMVHHNEYPMSTKVRSLNAFLRKPYSLWVNKKGERFADETIGSRSIECGNVLDRQPEGCVYTILDAKMVQNIIEETNARVANMKSEMRGWNVNEQASLEKDLESESAKGEGVKIANSWNDIADWMSVSPEVLKTTIEEYNSYCEKGHDEVFAKDIKYLQALKTPPYYAIKSNMIIMTSIGGIKINHRMEVLNNKGNPIPGLYAGGDCSGGWEADTYCMVLSGSGLGFAINSGRIAGENAGRFVSEN